MNIFYHFFFAVCKCIGGSLVRDLRGIRPEYYKLLPILCIHESNELEPILAKECNMALGDIAQAIVPASVIPTCLEAIQQVYKSSSWRARASVLELLQVSLLNIFCHTVGQKIRKSAGPKKI